MNEADSLFSSKMGLSSSLRQYDGNFSSASISVSSSMDSKQVASLEGIKNDKLSYEAFKGIVDARLDIDLLSPSLSSTGKQCSSCKTSNLLSACSSHDSSSENSESKATLRASANFEDCGVHTIADVCPMHREVGGVARSPVVHHGQIFLNQSEKLKKLERLDDNISSISRSDCTHVKAGYHKEDADVKKKSCGLTSVDNYTATGKTFNSQSICCGLAGNHFDKANITCSRTPLNFVKGSFQEIEDHSNKSNESEISSLTTIHCDPNSQLRCPELSEEQVESSVTKTLTFGVGQIHGMHCLGEPAIISSQMNHASQDAEALKCSDQKICNEKSDMMFEGNEACFVSNSVKDNDGLDNLEDVKVCDICGDAGREDLLATCSICADGAEHIYCMRVKLDKVPKGNWMCEECVLMEKSEKEKQTKFVNTDKSEVSVFNELSKNSGNSGTISLKNNLEESITVPGVKENKKKEVGSTSCFSVKRSAGSLEIMSMKKRRVLETNVKSPRVSTPCSKHVLRSDSSFKNVSKEKTRTAHDVTSGERSHGSNAGFSIVSADKSTKFLPPPHGIEGSLLQSKSFENTKPKMKREFSDVNHPQRKKICKDAATGDCMKKGGDRKIQKSMSFSSARADHSNNTDSPVKMQFHFESLKKLKHERKENTNHMKYRSKLGKLSDGSHVQKQKSFKNSGTSDGMKKRDARTFRKSISFNSMRADHWKCTDSTVKMQFRSEDLKKSKNASEENTTQMKYRSKLGNPLMSSLMASSVSVAVKSEEKNSSSGRTTSLHISRSTSQDLKDGHKKIGLAQKSSMCLNNEETKAVTDVKQHIDFSTQAAYASRENNSDTIRVCDLNIKKEDSPNEIFPSDGFHYLKSSTTIAYPVSAIPCPDYIWRGGFEIWRSGTSSGYCHGIQAHMSNVASPRVHEVVHSIPQKVTVEEVPQSSTWPNLFPKDYASEDDIALYFFAEDVESYRRHYKILLNFLISNDLALKANFDGVELLIFPSNLLPQKSQRWNALLFLWGVFKGQRDCYSEEPKLSKVLPQTVSSLKGKRDSNPKQEMDDKSGLQHSEKYITNMVRIERETESKSGEKCLSEKYERNSYGCTIYPVDEFPFQMNGLDSKLSGEGLGCNEAKDSFFSTKEQMLTLNDMDQSEPVEKGKLDADHHGDLLEHVVPNLELTLGPARTSMKQELMPLFPSVTELTNHESKSRVATDYVNGYGDEFSASLSLSLALPSFDKESYRCHH